MDRLIFFQGTDRGKAREQNEDFFAAILPEDDTLRLKEGSLFVMADGLGGLPDGEVASREAVRAMEDLWRNFPDFESDAGIRKIFQAVNEKICAMNAPRAFRERMGTTLTASFFRGRRLFIGHVGDCRVYRMRGGGIECLTRDQSIGRHTLTQAVGLETDIRPDVYECPLSTGDIYIQCSDGLHGVLSDRQIHDHIVSGDPQASCAKLVERANALGGPDNISVQVVEIL